MKRISVDESVVRNHVTVMEDCSESLRRDEQALGSTAELNEREPYSVTDPGVRLESSLTDALESYEASLAVMGDELLSMAHNLTQLAGEVTAVDEDLADRLRLIADGIDGGTSAAPISVRPLPLPTAVIPDAPGRPPVFEALPKQVRLDPVDPGDRITPIAPDGGVQA